MKTSRFRLFKLLISMDNLPASLKTFVSAKPLILSMALLYHLMLDIVKNVIYKCYRISGV